ncbi:hypothetical protein Hanom_Chr14g01257491 [Helianthus anomalus]
MKLNRVDPEEKLRKMDGVNELDENGKISNLLDLDAKNKPLNKSRKTGRKWHFA